MNLPIELKFLTCCKCGFSFAGPEDWVKMLKNTHRSFWCPSCETGQHFPQETDAERYKRLLDAERDHGAKVRNRASTLERKMWGMKGYATKLKNQVDALNAARKNKSRGDKQ